MNAVEASTLPCPPRLRHLARRGACADQSGLDATSFDLVTAGQCWHWFDGDAVLAEVQRVLRPGGVMAIVSYSYLTEHSPVSRETEDLILEFNPSWNMAGSTGVFPEQIDEVIRIDPPNRGPPGGCPPREGLFFIARPRAGDGFPEEP